MTRPSKPFISDYLAIALICFSIVLFQLTLTKLLSTIAWYHYTFLTLSLVMLGMGTPGIWLATARNPLRFLPYLLLLGAGSLVAAELVIMHFIAPMVEPFSKVLLIILAILVPMFCLGGCVCLYLMKAEGKRFGKMYAADLLGAFAGAALAIPAISTIPVPQLIALLGAMLLVVLLGNVRQLVYAGACLLLAILALLWIGTPFQLHYSKYDESHIGRIYEQWTPITRITVFDNVFFSPHPDEGFAWGPGKHFPRRKIQQYWIEQDAGAGTPMTAFDGDTSKLDYLLADVTSVAYTLRPAKSAAIIGGGGGRDILTALAAGIKNIKVIELNKAMVDVVSKRYGAFTGDIYHRDGVDVEISEGRSYLMRHDATYDLIQISLIDSWAASMAGAFALAENNLYTKEAYKTYFSKLNPDGLITTSRWIIMGEFKLPAYEVKRLALLVYESLRELGVPHPERHIAIILGDKIGNVITSKSPFSEGEIARLRSLSQREGFTIAYPQLSGKEDKAYSELLSKGNGKVLAQLFDDGVDITPPTDDRPFFFNVLRPFPLKLTFLLAHLKNDAAIQMMQNAVFIVVALTLLLFFVPFLDNYTYRLLPYRELLPSSLYFAAIGCGFMAMEVYMVQKFILYMGNPAYSASAVLSCLLLGLAAGARVSADTLMHTFRRFAWVMPVATALVPVLMHYIFDYTLAFSFPAKIAVTFLLVFPCAFIGGFFFPAGMERFGDRGKPWFWAINGSFGVLASVMSLPVAMSWGYHVIIACAALAYLLAVAIFYLAVKKQ